MTNNNKSILTLNKIGQNLKKFIKNSKFKTQENFAYNGMFVDERTVRSWIRNGINKIDVLMEVAQVLDKDFMEFFN